VRRDYPDRPVVGVGAVVWRGDRLLLIRRGRPPRLGQWSLPGGGQQLGETLSEAVAREVREETSLELASIRLITTVDLIERDHEGRVQFHYTLIDFTAEAEVGEPIAGDDAVDVAWFRPDQLEGLGLWTETLRIIGLAASLRSTAEVP
jgi:ADP-ribose pyrophosphatase YjhB (NUDIX family)